MAIALDGVNDYLTVPFSSDYELPGDFAISIKVSFDSLTGINKRGLIALGRGANSDAATGGGASAVVSAWWLRTEAASFGIARYEGSDLNGTFIEYYRSFTFSTNTLYTITVTRTGATLKLYVNENQVGADFATSLQFTQVSGGKPQPLTIGKIFTGDPSQQPESPNYASYLKAKVSEIAIWKGRGLSVPEVTALSTGFTADQIAPQNITFYAPLVSNLQDVKGGAAITNNNGATVANHPRVYT